MNFTQMTPYLNMFFDGLLMTLFVSFIAVAIGTVLGFSIAKGRLSNNKIVVFLLKQYVDIIRGTPLILQIILFYYVIVPKLGISLSNISFIPDSDAIFAGIIAVSLNSAAYVSEIFRGGIQSIERGQIEASLSLGLTNKQTMRYVTLPQTIRRVLPAIFNEFITVTKETAIVSVIGLRDIMYVARLVGGKTYNYLEPLIIAAAIYYVLTKSLSSILVVLERKLQVNDQS